MPDTRAGRMVARMGGAPPNFALRRRGLCRSVAGFMRVTPGLVGFQFCFGAEAASPAGDDCGAALPVLAGVRAETLFAGARSAGRERGYELFETGEWLVGVRRAEADASLEAGGETLGRDLLELARERGLHVARIWNYVPAINADAPEGLENYRVFCRGRARAFELAGEGAPPPAASAVGADGGGLAVMFAASRERPRVFENPEQMPAYEYPPEHGPRSPSFSRASQVVMGGRRWTFVSGTAAIKGHRSIAPGELAGQLDCTLDNLRLISRACGLGEQLAAGAASERHFKVYLRHASDLDAVRAELATRLLREGDRVSWLRSDICRAELRLEIEATVVD